MAGRLAIDFGNTYTVAAYWRQASRQAETLYIPGITRPLPNNAADTGKRVYAAPSLIMYREGAGGILIGQEIAEGLSGLVDDRAVFKNLRFDVVTGKRVYRPAGSRRLSGQDAARDYLAGVISRAGQALGLGQEAVITFTVPVEACQAEVIWQRYRQWLTAAVRQAGFNRLELVEEAWAAAWGAGMPVRPDDIYAVVNLDVEMLAVAVIQAGKKAGSGDRRHIRILSHVREWLSCQDYDSAAVCSQLTALLQQALREAGRLGYSTGGFTGVVVTGGHSFAPDILATVHNLFAGIPVYDKRLREAAACGAATLAAGVDACGYIRHDYGLRYLAGDSYRYRLLVAGGTFYPSDKPVAELELKASYDGQEEFALLIYRLENGGGQCVNEDGPLILAASPAGRGQSAIKTRFSIDGAGRLVVTAEDMANGHVIADNMPVAKLI